MASNIWQSHWVRACSVLLILSFVTSALLAHYARWIWVPLYQQVFGKQTVPDVIAYCK